jgi:ferric-dicitrate binding protein FerR (iron transport regulator)
VKEGQVVVTAGAAPARTVSAGGKLAVAKDGTLTEPSADALAEAFSWMDGKVIIGNRSMKDALNELRRWYGLDLIVKDSSLLSRSVSLSVDFPGSKKGAIDALEKGGNVKFAYEGQTPTLHDAPSGGKAAKKAR